MKCLSMSLFTFLKMTVKTTLTLKAVKITTSTTSVSASHHLKQRPHLHFCSKPLTICSWYCPHIKTIMLSLLDPLQFVYRGNRFVDLTLHYYPPAPGLCRKPMPGSCLWMSIHLSHHHSPSSAAGQVLPAAHA